MCIAFITAVFIDASPFILSLDEAGGKNYNVTYKERTRLQEQFDYNFIYFYK